VLNKADLVPETPAFKVEDERVIAVFSLSCATGQGLDDLQRRLFTLVPEPAVEAVADDELPEFLVYRPEPKARGWRLFRTDRGFRVVGTPPSEEELERALRAAGARNGAEVEVGEESFELAP
jgi:hypothetical protein